MSTPEQGLRVWGRGAGPAPGSGFLACAQESQTPLPSTPSITSSSSGSVATSSAADVLARTFVALETLKVKFTGLTQTLGQL